MRKVCQSDLGNTGKELFGEKFRKTLKSKADSMVALGKLLREWNRTLETKTSVLGGPSTSRYAGGAGKNHKLYQKTSQNPSYSRWNQPRRYFNQNKQQKQDFPKPPAINGGCHIKFSHSPPLKNSPPHCQDPAILSEEIQSLQEKSAITCLSTHPGPGFYSNVFVVLKRDGGWRPIINLRKLKYSTLQNGEHLQLERYPEKGDWLAKIDLKDAYLTVPMAKGHQKYLRFQWRFMSSSPFHLIWLLCH